MENDLKRCLEYTHQTLKHYILIHNKIFDTPRGILGKIRKIIKPMDFSGYLNILAELTDQLDDLREVLKNIENSNRDSQELLYVLKQFNLALDETIGYLSVICKGLLAKSQNESYPLNEYQKDLSIYEKSECRYRELGAALNRIYQDHESL